MAKISVQTDDFDVAAEIALLTGGRTDIGGLGCFVGLVRNDKQNASPAESISALTLEHYPSMTLQAITRIIAEAESRWNLVGCTVIHRVGRIPAGGNIVLVLTAAAHRQQALESTSFLIDWLKTKAPFWKQEEFADGKMAWVEARRSDDDAAARW